MRRRDVSLNAIIDFLGEDLINIHGDSKGNITNLADVEHTTKDTLDWVNPRKENKQGIVEASPARVILVDSSIDYSEELKEQGKTLLVVENPKLALARIGNAFFADLIETGIHPSSYVSPDAEIADDVSVGPFCYIGKARIGESTVIGSHVRIYDDVMIGSHCVIKDGAVIGGEGFGFERDENGNRFRFPQIGGVVIGNHVDIGANTCIDRGALSDTIIEDYAKIDNLCHIAHNVRVGKNAVITACSEVSGSCTIGENAWIGPNTSVRDWRNIGRDSTIGIGTNVVKNVPENEVWAGNPAKKLK